MRFQPLFEWFPCILSVQILCYSAFQWRSAFSPVSYTHLLGFILIIQPGNLSHSAPLSCWRCYYNSIVSKSQWTNPRKFVNDPWRRAAVPPDVCCRAWSQRFWIGKRFKIWVVRGDYFVPNLPQIELGGNSIYFVYCFVFLQYVVMRTVCAQDCIIRRLMLRGTVFHDDFDNVVLFSERIQKAMILIQVHRRCLLVFVFILAAFWFVIWTYKSEERFCVPRFISSIRPVRELPSRQSRRGAGPS